jgi:hypothetical protein
LLFSLNIHSTSKFVRIRSPEKNRRFQIAIAQFVKVSAFQADKQRTPRAEHEECAHRACTVPRAHNKLIQATGLKKPAETTGDRGMSFCTDCGAQLVTGAAFCSKCGMKQEAVAATASSMGAPLYTSYAYASPAQQEDALIRRIAEYERISGILWIVLGVIQILCLVGIIAGIWNIFAGRSRLKFSPVIASRDATVPQAYDSITQLVVIGVINVLVGGFIGVAFVAFDFYIRDKVLSNAHLFNRRSQQPSLTPA